MTNLLQVLGLCLSASCGSFSQPTRSLTRSHTVEYDTYQITYKYETNEVTTEDDLYVGRLYRYEDLTITSQYMSQFASPFVMYSPYCDIDYLTNDGQFISEILLNQFESSNSFIWFYFDTDTCYLSPSCGFDDGVLNQNMYIDIENEDYEIYFNSIDFMVNDNENLTYLKDFANLAGLPSASEFNIIESVEPIEHNDSLFGFVYDFVYNTILDIPNIDNYSFEVFGASTSLRQYLSISICVVLAILFLVLLFYLIRYIFRAFSGLWS